MQTSRIIAALLGVLLLPAREFAQGAPGAGEDALLLPSGTVRVRVGADWVRFYERYGRGTPGRNGAALEPLGADFSMDTIGVGTLENLAPVQAGIRNLAGMPDFTASLGQSIVRLRDHVLTTPVSLEFGLSRHIMIGVSVPFVTATAEADMRMNPTGREPTLGLNPTFAAPAAISANAALLTQFDSAAAQLNQRLAACAANPAATGCGPLNANRTGALALIANANAFAAGVAQVYGGRNGASGALFVPIAGTPAQAAIDARVAAYKALYTAFGTGAISASGPLAAQAPFTVGDMQHVLTDTIFGVRARPIVTAVSRGVGDIDLSLKLNLFGAPRPGESGRLSTRGLRWRQSLGGVYRLGTGVVRAADDLTGLGTGDHQNDLEMRSFTDLLFGAHLWLSFVARYNMQRADQVVVRIPDAPHSLLTAAYREQTVARDLGDALEVEFNPRWALNDYVGFSGHYLYRRKFSDSYTGKFTVADLTGQPVVIDAATLGLETEAREHRFGGGLSYSTVFAHEQGKARVPIEVTFLHFQTTRGFGGFVPKLSEDRVEVRWYGSIFGGR
jgi:hypothetical protein